MSQESKKSEPAGNGQMLTDRASRVIWILAGTAVGVIVGFALALIFCYFTWVRDLQVHLAAKEKALNDWAELNRQERATIVSMKSMSTAELNKAVADMDRQSTFFMDMQRRLHQVEVTLTGPGTTYILLGIIALLGVVALVVAWLRNGDREAATTLENVAALAPEEMFRAVLVRSLAARKEPLTITVEERSDSQRPKELPHSPKE